MIIRVVGGILICVSCFFLGQRMAARGLARARSLAGFKQSLVSLKSQIQYAAYTLPQAFANIAAQEGEFSEFYNALAGDIDNKETNPAAAWANALKAHSNQLSQEDIKDLSAIGTSLGSIDANSQLTSIDMSVAAIDQTLEQLAKENAKNSKMYKRLGLLGGLLITVVLL